LAVQDGGLSGLKVYVRVAGSFGGGWFFARMTNDGRLTIPKLALKLLLEGEEESLIGSVIEVTVEPADEQGECRQVCV
jgi:hypothetical protein